MSVEISNHADIRYRLAEQKAARYFAALYEQVREKSYASSLTQDFRVWKKGRLRHPWASWFDARKRQSGPRSYERHIQWLRRTGKLDGYLDRSVTYMYMRDLGKAMDDPGTQERIARTTASVKRYLLRSLASGDTPGSGPAFLGHAGLYRWAQKEGVEPAAIWVVDKLKAAAAHIPSGMSAEQAQRKLIKIIIGVVLHAMDEMDGAVPPAERARRLDSAIRLGYSYGLTCPFIDDLLDSQVLSAQDKERYSRMIHTALLTGTVPEPGRWSGEHAAMIRYAHAELREAFEYMRGCQRPETRQIFFDQSYLLFRSQEADRAKELSHARYTNEEIYIPIILKSAASRLIVRSAIGAPADEGFDERTFYYGIYNQLADDFADLFDDLAGGAVTPYTYYWRHREERPDLVNPYELYWTVIDHLIHRVYGSDAKAREVMLDRAINGLKRCRARVGADRYNELMAVFASDMPDFDRLVQRMVRSAGDVEFFDKLLRDEMIVMLRSDREEQERFLGLVREVRKQINDTLRIAKHDEIPEEEESLVDAANYSLEGGGKRLRPILTWSMAVNEYGLDASAIVPLLRSLEYMHTASLIFDDLPSQDNAPTRRGRPTLHRVHNVATAELTGLYLIQRAIREQSSLDRFDPQAVLALIRYSSKKAEEMCMGQAMDLEAKGKPLTLEQLNRICFYKTGIGFEAALVMPAILAQAPERDIAVLKKYAYHAGIAFQIKDDLLDLEGDLLLLGKPVGQDAENNTSTFVSILGREGAAKAMWEHYCSATEALAELPQKTAFLKHLLHYMIHRNR